MKRLIRPIFAAALALLAVCLWKLVNSEYVNGFDQPINKKGNKWKY